MILNMDKLKDERLVFEKNLNEWRISHLGEFVLIKGSELIGFFPTLDGAFNEGLARFGMDDFLVEQISPDKPVNITFYGRAI